MSSETPAPTPGARRPLDITLLELSLRGRELIVLDQVESTNDYLLDRADEMPDGAIVVAEEQTAGRGRRGRSWHAPRSAGLLLSILVKAKAKAKAGDANGGLAVAEFPRLTHFAAVAVAGGIEGAQIKWPNDVFLGGKKLAGVLVESRGDAAVVGIGVNTDIREDEFPADLEQPATSLAIASGRPVDREAFLCALVGRFKAWLNCPLPFADFIQQQVKPISLLLGREIEYRDGSENRLGWAIDLGPAGELLVDPGDGSIASLNSVDQVRLK